MCFYLQNALCEFIMYTSSYFETDITCILEINTDNIYEKDIKKHIR